jgi:CBS domain containing-hemolysin-like protein
MIYCQSRLKDNCTNNKEIKKILEEESGRTIFGKILSRIRKPHLLKGSDLTEEINNLMDKGQAKGLITNEESEMVHGILELKETMASEVMIPRTNVLSASINSTIGELTKLVTTCGHTRIPIYKDTIDEIVGVLHSKDLLKFLGEDPNTKIPLNILRKPYFVPGNQIISKLLKDLKAKKTHLAIVTDEYGGIAGIITIEDILEEIVGEIMDEYDRDREQPLFSVIDKNSVVVNARMDIEKVEEHFNIDFPEGEYESLGGFIIHMLGRIPKVDEKIQYKGLEMIVKSADERKINKVLITLITPPDSASTENNQP